MLKKRIRSSNFNGEEEEILVKCILQHATIIENKKTDACTLKEKQRAWEEIGNEFNALCPNPNVARHTKALKDKYTNLKTMLRKQFAVNRKAIDSGKEIPEWRPRTEAMAELVKLLSTSMHDAAAAFDDGDYDNDDNDNDYDYESHETILPPFESFNVEPDEKPVDLINLQTTGAESLQNSDNNCDSVKNISMDNNFPIKISQPSTSTSRPWSKYTPLILRKQNKFKQKRLLPPSSRSDTELSLQSLKKKMIERTLEMREIEHHTRLSQQQKEHEARMALLEAQKMDFETKVKLRQLKIAKLTNDKNVKTEIDCE